MALKYNLYQDFKSSDQERKTIYLNKLLKLITEKSKDRSKGEAGIERKQE